MKKLENIILATLTGGIFALLQDVFSNIAITIFSIISYFIILFLKKIIVLHFKCTYIHFLFNKRYFLNITSIPIRRLTTGIFNS